MNVQPKSAAVLSAGAAVAARSPSLAGAAAAVPRELSTSKGDLPIMKAHTPHLSAADRRIAAVVAL
jgi:hypothetical protein